MQKFVTENLPVSIGPETHLLIDVLSLGIFIDEMGLFKYLKSIMGT